MKKTKKLLALGLALSIMIGGGVITLRSELCKTDPPFGNRICNTDPPFGLIKTQQF